MGIPTVQILSPKQMYDHIQARQFVHLIDYVSPHYRWAEVFTGLVPDEIIQVPFYIYENAYTQSGLMEEIRRFFGDLSIDVISWYRTVQHNHSVGGAPHSQHLLGLATDFTIAGMESAAENRTVQSKLSGQVWMANKGLEFTGGRWTHADSRSEADGIKYGWRFYK